MEHELELILRDIRSVGGLPLIVGGWVRDYVLGGQPKDVDVEVYGLAIDRLRTVLALHGLVDMVGVSFGVLKVHGLDVDFSVPRRDNRVGVGHKGFTIETNSNMSIKDASARRDFTINSMAYNPEDGEVYDPYGGIADLRAGILRHTSAAFTEDPLRVLRGMQFCGRYELAAAPETVALARSIRHEIADLSLDRVWGEWWKWASKSVRPSLGLVFLRRAGWLPHQLGWLVGCQQDSEWHPEGDVWQHTLLAVDAAASLGRNPDEQGILVLTALLHDLGKPYTTSMVDGRIVSPGHAQIGADLAGQFLDSIGCPVAIRGTVVTLVREHMAHIGDVTARTVRRLANRLGDHATIRQLVDVITCDHSARPPLPGGTPESAIKMLAIAESMAMDEAAPKALVMGRHLIELGFTPGKEMGSILRMAFDAQLDGEFETLEDGIAWVLTRV